MANFIGKNPFITELFKLQTDVQTDTQRLKHHLLKLDPDRLLLAAVLLLLQPIQIEEVDPGIPDWGFDT